MSPSVTYSLSSERWRESEIEEGGREGREGGEGEEEEGGREGREGGKGGREGREGGREGGRGGRKMGSRVEPIMLISHPVILFCNSCHPSLLFLLHAPIIPVILFQINFLMKYTPNNLFTDIYRTILLVTVILNISSS